MAEKRMTLKKIIESIEKDLTMKKLPPEIRRFVKNQLESIDIVKFPIVTIKEEGEWVAYNPILGICAQGKTEKEAFENLKAMMYDYMTDPDTYKPKIETILNMEIGIKDMSMKLPPRSFQMGEHNVRENTPITSR